MQQPPDDVAIRHLAQVVESSDDAIVSKDLNSIITSWNRAAERMFGYTAGEAVGQSVRMLIPADRQGEEDMVLARIRAGEAITHFETIRQRKDGTRYFWPWTVPVTLAGSRKSRSAVRRPSANWAGSDFWRAGLSRSRSAGREPEQRLSRPPKSGVVLKDVPNSPPTPRPTMNSASQRTTRSGSRRSSVSCASERRPKHVGPLGAA